MVINITDKTQCNGCCACVDVCPHKAISLEVDIEGFWYPKINVDTCVKCGLCVKVCPELQIKHIKKNDYPKPKKVYAAINKNLKVRWDSTSGGAFSALADEMYSRGGYVSGAMYNEDFSVSNFISNDKKDLSKLRSSKYLQSKAEGLFIKIQSLLRKGEEVLACGTPCQMAALRSFLRKDYANLLIVDFICRGVNSPKVYRSYLDSLEAKYGGKVVYVKAKNKELGWRNLTRKVTFDNGQSYYGIGMDDDFRRGYHTNVYCRPSCYSCKYKGFPRIADITIGDYWGIEKVDKNLDNNIGTSVVLVNSKKGEVFFEKVQDKMECLETPLGKVLPGNIALRESINEPTIDRASFFKDLDESDFNTVVSKYFPATVGKRGYIYNIKKILKKYLFLFRTIGGSLGSIYNFLWINFFRRNTSACWASGNLIYTMPSAVFDINKTARINIEHPILFANNPVKRMRVPSCLRMEANTSLTIKNGPITRYGDGPYNLRYGAYIEIVNGGHLTLGQGACNVGLTIMCAKEVRIGNGVRIGRDVSIRDWNGSHVIVNENYQNHSPVIIEDNVWIATGASILPGVKVGKGSVVAAHSVVTKDVPPNSLVGGVPAKIIRQNIKWY